MRVLDELADAFHAADGEPAPRRRARSLALGEQLALPMTPAAWRTLGDCLRCELPPLPRGRALSRFPPGWQTLADLADHVVRQRPGLGPLGDVTLDTWRQAQVFAGVRACLVEALNVWPQEVMRSARLMADLGAE